MTYDPQRHHRRSIRLPGYDYSQEGVIFVTACTYQRENLFGEIVAGQMVLNDIGRIVLAAWQGLPSRFLSLTLDEFVVMPNHVHGILIFEGGQDQKGAARQRGRGKRRPYIGTGHARLQIIGGGFREPPAGAHRAASMATQLL